MILVFQPSSLGMTSLGEIGICLFNFLLSLSLAQTADKLANALLNGQPSLSVGDMSHAMHSAAGMARTAKNTAGMVASAPGKVASHTIQPVGRHVGNMLNRKSAALAAAESWGKMHQGDAKYHEGGKFDEKAFNKDKNAYKSSTGWKIMTAQTLGNIRGALTGTSNTRGFRVKDKDGKLAGQNLQGTGMGGHSMGDYETQRDKMRELGERIATGAVDKEGNPLIKPKENMGKKPGSLES